MSFACLLSLAPCFAVASGHLAVPSSGTVAGRVTQSEEDRASAPASDGPRTPGDTDGRETESHRAGEDPDADRRLERALEPDAGLKTFEWSYYGSVRLHAIDNFDLETGATELRLGDGASRVGVTADWQMTENWNLFGRAETGFDILDTFTAKGQNDDDGALSPRLYNLSIESDWLFAKLGKSWSTYYKVAGAADRFLIFGGKAAGIYNAGTDGGATGTGRADDALQSRFYLDIERWTSIRPFNVNLQLQQDQPIPRVSGKRYDTTVSFSAWLESEGDLGVGIAWHRASIDEPGDPAIVAAGIDGDATAMAASFTSSGERWYAGLVLTRLENIETTDQGQYFKGYGIELYADWQLSEKWWVVGGGNWLDPDSDQSQAGDYTVRDAILGVRYILEQHNSMFYAEWRNDWGTLSSGLEKKNEFTIGFRWDFER